MSVDSTTQACRRWDNSECEGTPYCPPRCPRFVDKNGTPLLVRPYQADDFDALVTMYDELDSYSRTMGLPPATRPQIRNWLTTLVDRGWNLVVRDDQRVVGHVATTPSTSSTPEFVIFVHQDFRNCGVGTELMKQLVAYADDNDHEALTLEVSSGNGRAISVYENIGFDVVERTLREIRMELPMDDPVVERAQRPPAERH